jgi:hypothetical protein
MKKKISPLKVKRLNNTARVVQVINMSIDEMEFEVPDDFGELLDDLYHSDPFFELIRIYDPKVKEVLENAELIKTNGRGGCWGTEKLKLKKNFLLLKKALYKCMPLEKYNGKED